jgi:pimeloyl-ACP methyl ester carboxylesterase
MEKGRLSTLTLGTAELQYADQGQGELLVLVHGGVFADWFGPMAASTALQHFRVIRVRRAGYGRAAPSAIIGIREHAEHLIGLMNSLSIDRVHLAGHSSGALIALQLAAEHPERVQTLVLIEPAPAGPFQVPAFGELAERFVGPAIKAFADGDVRSAFDKFMLGVCGPDFREVIERSLGKESLGDALQECRFFFANEVPAVMQWQFDATAAERIRLPVLIVEGGAGRHAGPLSQQVTEAVSRLFPAADVALIENTTHLMPLQAPDELGQALARFATRHKSGRAEGATSPS